MDSVSLSALLTVAQSFGPMGLVLLFWWVGNLRQQAREDEYRKNQTTKDEEYRKWQAEKDAAYQALIRQILEQYRQDMAETRRMYEDNVKLVMAYQDLTSRIMKVSEDFSDVVLQNTAAMTRINDAVLTNQYCPHVRLVKVAGGKVAE